MSLSSFFTDVLGANLANTRWSWGAEDPMTHRVFLRVWENQIKTIGGTERVSVIWDNPTRYSHGYGERKRQLELIENGAEGFGVVCRAVDPHTKDARKIASFNKETLLRFGTLIHENGKTYATIQGRVSASIIAHQRTSQSTLTEDLKSILKKNIEPTTKEALVNARVGQGKFRMQVLQQWGHRCCVTGASTLDAIRASHIKPWSESTDEERLDSNNGLPLTANLDALFDAGLLAFEDSGKLIASSKLTESERRIFAVHDCSMVKPPSSQTASYLAYHREKRFQK